METAGIQILLIICPGVISAFAFMNICKRKCEIIPFVINTARFALMDFCVINLFLFLRGERDFSWTYFSPSLILKLSLVIFVISIIMPIIAAVLVKFIQVGVEMRDTVN
ncbi:MAG: hypothetical protein J6P45_03850 [Lachnospiraceae bacterium]|nr:hypothetical protein [Lachnospiraceae bacterium]